jgi:hypothetical protein
VSDGINDGHAYTQGAPISVTGKSPRRELAEMNEQTNMLRKQEQMFRSKPVTDNPKVPIAEDLRGLHTQAVTDKSGPSTVRGFLYANIQQLILRTSRAEAALEALQWTPISAKELPEIGDEVLCWNNGQPMVGNVLEPLPVKRFRLRAAKRNGWTHRRPLTPPRREEKQP